ncbi:MAG: glycogen-binding domain-containing protein [Candidatus Latescibacterota bacterium]
MKRIFSFQLTIGAVAWIVLLTLWGCAGGGGPRSGAHGFSDQGPEITEGGAVFRYFDKNAKSVFLAGDFNNWTPATDPMIDRNGDGEWTLYYPLSQGRYEYKFVVDTVHWIADPTNPVSVSDGFKGRNSVIVIQ